MILEGGENIKYNASTTIRMSPQPWHAVAGQAEGRLTARVAKRVADSEVTDENTLKYLEHNMNKALLSGNPKEAAKFFSLTIKIRTLIIIKKHCI
jgi:hypothetical protein